MAIHSNASATAGFHGSAKRLPGRAWTLRVGRCSGFTLIELLVVISIIALLVAILLPALAKAKQRSQLIQCQSNIRQTAIALLYYSHEHKEELLATRFNISGGAVTAPDNSTVVLPNPLGQGGKWLDILCLEYMNNSTAALKCPTQGWVYPTYGAIPFGYGLNEFVIHYETDYGSFVDQGDRPHRLHEFLKPSNKLWLADSGMVNSQTDPVADRGYGTYIRSWASANRWWQTGVSGRHERGLNVGFFDTHAAYGKYDDYNLINSAYTGTVGDIRARSYSPTGRRQERNSGCADH